MLVEQLEMYSKDLSNLKSANPANDAQQVLNSLRATQEWEREEAREQIVEQVHHLDNSKASYQNLTEGFQQFEIVTKIAEGIIASARAAIFKAQTLIQDNEQNLANKKKVEELETAKSQVQQELTVHSSKMESLQTQYATKKLLSEEELRVQALTQVKKARQIDIQHLKYQIKSLAEWD